MARTGEATSEFFGLLQGAARLLRRGESIPSRRDQAACGAGANEAPTLPAPAASEQALRAAIKPVGRAEAAQDKRRNQLAVDSLAAAWIKEIKGGHYAYRCLKDAFDAVCDRAALDAVSDHRFARLLQHHGGEKYRCNYPKTTMYKMPRRRAKARSVEASQEMRC